MIKIYPDNCSCGARAVIDSWHSMFPLIKCTQCGKKHLYQMGNRNEAIGEWNHAQATGRPYPDDEGYSEESFMQWKEKHCPPPR